MLVLLRGLLLQLISFPTSLLFLLSLLLMSSHPFDSFEYACEALLFLLLHYLVLLFSLSLLSLHIVFTITVNSFENVSILAVPATFIPLALFILFITFLAMSLFKNDLHVIVLVPSYKSKLNKVFPDFKVLSSVNITSPCRATFPSSTPKSSTFTNGSVIFGEPPNIKWCFLFFNLFWLCYFFICFNYCICYNCYISCICV